MGNSVIFQGSKLKALKKEIQLGTGASRISGTADPTSSAVSAVAGSLYQNETSGKVYRKLDAGSSTNWVEVKESTEKNYIANGDALLDTSGWATYKNTTASSAPETGTGGSPNVTWTRTTSNPLSGPASFLFTKDAVNRQGEGVSYDFTVDRSDEGSILTCPFVMQPRTGTYSGGSSTTDSDLTVYIVSKEFGTVIQPSFYKLQGAVNDKVFKAVPVFQVPVSAGGANAREFRLCIHVATTSASAYTVAFDEIGVTPISQGIVPIVGDPQDYTPIWGASVSSPTVGDGTIEGNWTRIGKLCYVVIRLTSGSTTNFGSGTYDFRLPHPADTADMTGIKGRGIAWLNITGTNYTGTVELEDSFDDRVYIRGTGTDFWAHNTPATWANTSTIELSFTYPVKGWGSSVAVSPDTTSGRLVLAKYYHTTGTTLSSGDIINFNSLVSDSHSSVTTGASWNFTAQEPGSYEVNAYIESSAFVAASGDRWALQLYKNGALVEQQGRTDAESANNQIRSSSGRFEIDLIAGDYIDVRYNSSGVTFPLVGASGYSNIVIKKISNQAQIGPGDKIYAKYCGNGGTSITANVTNIDFSNKVYDSHGCWNGSVFTAFAPGLYCFTGTISSSSNNSAFFSLYKNGSIVDGALMNGANALTDNKGIHNEVFLNAGDTASIRSDTSLTLNNTTANHWLSIKRSA